MALALLNIHDGTNKIYKMTLILPEVLFFISQMFPLMCSTAYLCKKLGLSVILHHVQAVYHNLDMTTPWYNKHSCIVNVFIENGFVCSLFL